MAEASRRAFVVGHPISHSRSPMIHNYWLKQLGLTGRYERLDVAPDAFQGFFRELPQSTFVGGNVTIPHKEEAFRLAGQKDEGADIIGAANTLWLQDGCIHAGNTDASGFAADLDTRAPHWRSASRTLILGAGGAARAVIFAVLSRTRAQVHVINRTWARAQELADRFGTRVQAHSFPEWEDLATDADLVVNTTSLGMAGASEGGIGFDVRRLPSSAIVYDLVYTPLKTPLLMAAASRGLTAVDGLGMLLHQAVPGFERWFGQRPQVTEELRSLIIADIEARS